MRPLDFYLKNISKVYKCGVCGQLFDGYEEVKSHCIIESNNQGVMQESLNST